MKKFLKNNSLVLTILIASIIFILIPCIDYLKYNKDLESNSKYAIDSCLNLKEEYKTEERLEYCEKVIETGIVKIDFYTMLTSVLLDTGRFYILSFIIISILTIPPLNKLLKEKNIIKNI